MILNHEIPILILTPTKNLGIHGGLRVEGSLKDYVDAITSAKGALIFINDIINNAEDIPGVNIYGQKIELGSNRFEVRVMNENTNIIMRFNNSLIYEVNT